MGALRQQTGEGAHGPHATSAVQQQERPGAVEVVDGDLGAELAGAVESAVREQGRGEIAARFLSALALLALDTAHRRWIADPDGRSYGEHAHETLDELVAQASELPGAQARKG
ncbi:hypothetical protein GCM10010330_39910 [Streptomyces tendae]|nr:hypothetical protein GCM10010330_39910 [Streptomyces tendae]